MKGPDELSTKNILSMDDLTEKDIELIEKLKRFAEKEVRSFSNVCLLAFNEFLENHSDKIENQRILPFPRKSK